MPSPLENAKKIILDSNFVAPSDAQGDFEGVALLCLNEFTGRTHLSITLHPRFVSLFCSAKDSVLRTLTRLAGASAVPRGVTRWRVSFVSLSRCFGSFSPFSFRFLFNVISLVYQSSSQSPAWMFD